MKNKYFDNMDKQPKRTKLSENPYMIFTTGIGTKDVHYYLAFVDGSNIKHCMEISKKVFEAFNDFELDDMSFINERTRHYEKKTQTEIDLFKRALEKQPSIDDLVCKNIELEKLHQAIKKLPKVQRRRLMLYFFCDYTYEQIATMEGCKYQAIQSSIYTAIKKLKKFLF